MMNAFAAPAALTEHFVVLPITIGPVTAAVIVTETDAPESYDGMGTFTLDRWTYSPYLQDVLHMGEKGATHAARLVAVRAEHFDWQTMRYRSGLHYFADTRHLCLAALDVAERLWSRMTGEKGA